jgi:ribosome hibernation promoting factor
MERDHMKKGQRITGRVTVHVKGKNMSVAPELHDQVVRKMQKLDKYLDRLDEINVELGTESTRDSRHHNHVDATTHVAGRTIRVAASDSQMHAAIDDAVDKLYRQLNRHKERMKTHHGVRLVEAAPPHSETEAVPQTADADEPEDGPDPVLHVEPLDVEPQFEDEAVQELESRTGGFYVFLNARNEQINVVYRRQDGTYGLIEPRVR